MTGRATPLTPEQVEAIRKDRRSLNRISLSYNIGFDRVRAIKGGVATAARTLTGEEAAEIISDRRGRKAIAESHGVSLYCVDYCKNGMHAAGNAVLAARDEAARATKRTPRFYQPFRDGTYAR